MHYGSHAFSSNGNPTIRPLLSQVSLSELGQRSGFSDSDLEHVNILYCGEGTNGIVLLACRKNEMVFIPM